MIYLPQSHTLLLLPGCAVLLDSLKVFPYGAFPGSLPVKNISQHIRPEHVDILSDMLFLLQISDQCFPGSLSQDLFIQDQHFKMTQIQKFFLRPVVDCLDLLKVPAGKSQHRNWIFVRFFLSGSCTHIRHCIFQHKAIL